MNYFIEVLDQNEVTQIATIENAFNINIVRGISKPVCISFNVPIADSKLDETFVDSQNVSRPIVDPGNIVRVMVDTRGKIVQFGTGVLFGTGVIIGGKKLEAVGIITGPFDKTINPVQVTAYGLSIKLDRYRTPVSWNYEDTPANILRQILKEHRFQRRTTGADWDAGTYNQTQKTDGADMGDQSYYLLLGSDGGTPPLSPYYTSGDWISSVIGMGAGLTAWRRMKFKAGFGENTSVTFQTRSSPDNLDWTDPWTTTVDIDEWCENGYPITSPVQQYIQVKLNFATTNTDFSAVIQSLEVQGTYGNILTEGTGFADLPTDNVSYNPSYESQLKLLNTLLADCGKEVLDGGAYVWKNSEWEETTGGAINVAIPLGSDKSAQHTFHEYSHVEVLEYEEDDSDLVNYVIGLGTGMGLDQLVEFAQDIDSQDRYGKRVGIYESATEKTGSNLADATAGYLNKLKDPKRFVRLRVIDTPDSTWDFSAGDTIRFISPNYSVDTSLRIIRETRKFAENGFEIELLLTNPYPAVKSFVTEYLKEQSEFAIATDSAIKNYEAGDLWTDWIGASDVTWKQITIKVGFTPTDGNILPIQVLEDVTGYYTQPGAQIDYRIKDLRTGEIEFEYRRITPGLNSIRVQFSWIIWSRRRTFSSIGLGGQIE